MTFIGSSTKSLSCRSDKDVDTPIKEVKSIKAPRDVLAQLDKYININRDRYRVRGRDMVGGDGGHCHDHDDFDINDDII